MHGYVGIYTCRLEMPWVNSLKEKRALLTPITERLKSRFPVSVARLAGQNSHTWESIAVTTVHAEAVWVQEVLHKVADFVAQGGCTVAEEQTVLMSLAAILDIEDAGNVEDTEDQDDN